MVSKLFWGDHILLHKVQTQIEVLSLGLPYHVMMLGWQMEGYYKDCQQDLLPLDVDWDQDLDYDWAQCSSDPVLPSHIQPFHVVLF